MLENTFKREFTESYRFKWTSGDNWGQPPAKSRFFIVGWDGKNLMKMIKNITFKFISNMSIYISFRFNNDTYLLIIPSNK